MGAPDSKNLRNLSGNWKLNKELLDDFAPVLELQGVNTIIRKVTSIASVHLKISQPSENQLRMEQTATTEEYTLDWGWRPSHDAFFGDIEGRSRWIEFDEVSENESVAANWTDDCKGQGKKLIQAEGKKPDGTWIASHLWGFEKIGGERRHTRHVTVIAADGKKLSVRMVYDFEGE